MVSDNIPTSRHHGAAKHGDALLAGLLRCRRCGRKLTLRYTGTKHDIPRYTCNRGWLDHAEPRCIALADFGSMTPSSRRSSRCLNPGVIAAAVEAERQTTAQRDEIRDALSRDLEAARRRRPRVQA